MITLNKALDRADDGINVSLDELSEILSNKRGSTFASVVSETKPRFRKFSDTGAQCPFWDSRENIRKVSTRPIHLNIKFQQHRENIERRRGDPITLPGSSWHQVITRNDGTLTPLAIHNRDDSKQYLWYVASGKPKSVYVGSNGIALSPEDVAPWLPPYSQLPPVYNVLKLENIKSITLNKQTYKVQG